MLRCYGGRGGLSILLSGSRGPALAFGIAFLNVVATMISSPFRKAEDRARGAGWVFAGLTVVTIYGAQAARSERHVQGYANGVTYA